MERVPSLRFSEPITHARGWLTPRLLDLAECDIFCGDPIFAGLHRRELTDDGRRYRNTAHACYPMHTADRRTTVVFPEPPEWYTVIHELGHVIDWNIGERLGTRPSFSPVTEYAKTNRWEAFTEAFCAWFYPPTETYFVYDQESREFFDRLSLGGW